MKLKLPSFPKFKKPVWPKSKPKPKAFNIAARTAAPSALDQVGYDEPTARFSTAFFVVLVIHVFFLGGIWAFKTIKANRAPDDSIGAALASTAPASDNAVESQAPVPAQPAAPTLTSVPAPGDPSLPAFKVYHVKAGDSWPRIAAQFSVTSADLADFNGIKETAVLHPGETLNIPTAKTSSKTTTADVRATPKKIDEPTTRAGTPAASGKTYTVKKGDSPVAIARALNVSYADLLKLNKIDDPKKLQIGTVLKVPPPRKQSGA
jgi:LysM repeat protein